MVLVGLERLKSNLRILCRNLGDEVPEGLDQWDEAETSQRVADYVRHWGDPGHCRYANCRASIHWIQHKDKPNGQAGGKGPYRLDGLNHFADCPGAKAFRR